MYVGCMSGETRYFVDMMFFARLNQYSFMDFFYSRTFLYFLDIFVLEKHGTCSVVL